MIVFLFVINAICTGVAGFLIWMYYRLNQSIQFMLSLGGILLYYIVLFDLKGIHQIIFSLGCTVIFYILMNKKCKKIATEYRKKEQKEMEDLYKKYQATKRKK